MRYTRIAVLLALGIGVAGTAHAQTTATVVATCGTPQSTPVPGGKYPLTIDVTGKLCTSGTGGGGGGGAITAPLGPTTAPSAAVAITDTGTPPTGDTIPTGGQGLTGWLGAIYGAVTSSIPAGSNVIGGVTAADGALATEGAKADAAYAGSGSASIVAALKGVYTSVSSSIPAGSALIGKVGIDQTTPGTTNGVVINSASSLPLPTGAAISANQPTNAAQGSTTSGQTGGLMQGAVLTASPTYTTGQTSPLVLDTSGNLRVNVVTGAATGVAQGSTTSGQTGGLTQGAVTTAAPTYTTAQTSPLSLTTAGSLRQDLSSVAGTSAASLMVAPSTAPVTATNPALTVDLRPDSPGIITLGPAAVSGAVPFVLSSQYPANAVTTTPQPVTATATGTTAATVATIPAVASKTAYICGFTITADATALAVGTAVVSGTISGSLSYLQGISAVTSGAGNLTQAFSPCVPASAANTAIVVTSAAAGTGGNTIVNAQGYYL